MKKKILLMMATALCAGEVSLAAVPLDSAALGGITSGMTQEDIESIYGPADVLIPYEANRREGGYVSKLSYGNTVVIWMGGASASSTPKAEIIVVSANNGFATPEGIHVGSTKAEVIQAYGQPDFDYSNRSNTIARGNPPQTLMYKTTEGRHRMAFTVQNGVVTEIRVS